MGPTAKNKWLKGLSILLFLLSLFILFIFILLHLKIGVGIMIGLCLFALVVFFAAEKASANIKHMKVSNGLNAILEGNNESFFFASKPTINQLHALAKEIMAKKALYERIDAHEIEWVSTYDSSIYKLNRFIAMDMVLGYEKMGITVSPYSCALQGVLHFLLITNKDKEKLNYDMLKQAFNYFQQDIEVDVKEIRLLIQKAPERKSLLLVTELLEGDGYLQKKYYRLMHQYWKTVANYSGKLSEEEVAFLNGIADLHNEMSAE